MINIYITDKDEKNINYLINYCKDQGFNVKDFNNMKEILRYLNEEPLKEKERLIHVIDLSEEGKNKIKLVIATYINCYEKITKMTTLEFINYYKKIYKERR